MNNLFKYSDYRLYLADYYAEKKRLSEFSYKRFSEIAQFNSPNYLALIISGKRDLTIANIHNIAKALKLNEQEHVYFENLVLLNQSSTDAEKSFY